MGLQTLEDSKPKGAVCPRFHTTRVCLVTHRMQEGLILKWKIVIWPWQKKHGVSGVPEQGLSYFMDQKTEHVKERDVPSHTAH